MMNDQSTRSTCNAGMRRPTRPGGLWRCATFVTAALASAALTASASAIVIQGVQPAALDQPQVYAAITPPGGSTPYTAVIDFFGFTVETFTVQAYFDTGASGVLLSASTREALGVPIEPGWVFEDVGVGGSTVFDVSQLVDISLAKFPDANGVDELTNWQQNYNQRFNNIRMQVEPGQADPDPLLPPLDVFGMPLFQGKTIVMDARPVNALNDLFEPGAGEPAGEVEAGNMKTAVYDSGQVPGDVPAPHRTIQTTPADFSRFTQTSPAGAAGPTLEENPFIGPDPTVAASEPGGGQSNPGITVKYDGNSVTGSWLFDTGAVTSILSEANAALLGVTYVPGSVEAGAPVLQNVPLDEQFTLTIGGVGGTSTVAGFFLDEMLIPTVEGDPLVYQPAPVLVADINVLDPLTGDTITLDGVLGMNYLVASTTLTFSDIRLGAYDFLVYDQPSGELRLTFNEALIPQPAGAAVVAVAGLLGTRRQRR